MVLIFDQSFSKRSNWSSQGQPVDPARKPAPAADPDRGPLCGAV